MSLRIVSRASWGARPPLRTPYRPPNPATEVYLHHTAGAHAGAASMRSIQIYHQSADPSRNKSAWNDIAYNFVIDPHDLKVYEGRGWGVAPGAQQNHNVGTQAICVMGDFRSRQPTQGLLDVIANLIRTGHQLGHIPLVLTGGHKDAPGQSTSCPGQNLHSKIPAIRNLLEGADMKPPTYARAATQWHIDRGIYSGTVDQIDESEEFHRQTVFRHRFYNAIRSEFGGSGGAHDHDGRYLKSVTGNK